MSVAAHKLPPRVAELLDAAADKYNVPRPLARAIAWVESRGNTMAKSPAGAMGVMQLMPATARWLGVSDAHEPIQNIDAGVRYYAQLAARYGERLALAAYNWGPGNVQRHGGAASERYWPSETKNYVVNVLQRAEYELATMNTDRPAPTTIASGSRTAGAPLSSPASEPSSASRSHSRGDGGEHDA